MPGGAVKLTKPATDATLPDVSAFETPSSRKTLYVARPPATDIFWPEPAVEVSAMSWSRGALSTPGCKKASPVKSRLFRGISVTRRSSTRFETVAVVVSTKEASPVTVIACATSPTCSAISTTALRPTVSVMPLRTSVWKPVRDARTSYSPTGRATAS